MRFNFRIKIGNITIFFMISQTQTIEGVNSLLLDGKHIIMWDLENCSQIQAENTLKNIQRRYGLSDIFIVSDIEGSYRAWCFSKRDWKTFMKILLDTDYLDDSFLYYAFTRKKATLRTSIKQGRARQRIVSVLKSYPMPLSSPSIEQVVYDTGLEKRGISILIGDRE